MTRELRVGLLGAGMIASCDWGVLPGAAHLSPQIRITAIAASTTVRSVPLANEYSIPLVFTSLDQMLESAEVDAVMNLTPISEHADTSRRIVGAGKHLITEKPLTATMSDADALIGDAAERGVLIVSSPPSMLMPSRSRARELVAEGEIGRVAFARVRSSHAGPAARAWPTDPSWFYGADAGPLLDMGPYGIQSITGILGPAIAVTAFSARTAATRIVTGGPFDGTEIQVGSDDNVLLMLDFGQGALAVVDCTFNVRAARSPVIELFGLEGSIAIHDDIGHGHPAVELFRPSDDGLGGEWEDATSVAGFAARSGALTNLRRASLIQHLWDCLVNGVAPTLSAEHARHTLEIMLGAQESATSGRRVEVHSSFSLPPADS